MDILWLVIVFGVLAWLIFSPDKLASTLRARIVGGSRQAADALDDAVDRVEKSEAELEGSLAKANGALIDVKTMRHTVQNLLKAARDRVTKYQTAAENAASVGRRDLVEAAVARKNEAAEEIQTLQAQEKFLLAKEGEVQKAVTTLVERKAKLLRQKVEIKTRAKTAKTTLSVNELMAGVDLDGNVKDVERAYEIVEELEAKSGAMAEVAEAATAGERLDKELEALSKPSTNEAAEVDALLAKFGKKAEPAG